MRKTNKTNLRFQYQGKNLEVVDSFKYLGIMFNFNGTFNMCKKDLSEQASKVMFFLLSKCQSFSIPLDLQCELFDRLVVPILLYGSEVWGFRSNAVAKRVHLKFCKYSVKLKKSTGNCMVYGELGRFPIEVAIKTRMIGYWGKIVTGKQLN